MGDRPRILDLFCGAGGASQGYADAGFEVVGVDIAPQPNYPFRFLQADALEVLEDYVSAMEFGMEPRYDAIHASPPCQSSSLITKGTNQGMADRYEDLIEPTRVLLKQIGLPYVIENVQGAPVRADLRLCGEQFGLRVIRHRLFELEGFTAPPVAHIKHRGTVMDWRHGKLREGGYYYPIYGTGGSRGTLAEWKIAMECDWMKTKREVSESIPRKYTEYIGRHLKEQL